MRRVFVDTSVLTRYFAEDDVPRALAAAQLVESDAELVISTSVLIELIHSLRTQQTMTNPQLGGLLIRFLSRPNVVLSDAGKADVISALLWTQNSSARRIPDAIISAAAHHAEVDFIATFDEKLRSPSIPVRLL
jgi:Predicted nucleic acid-binding protein, contains PIN domain